MRTIRSPALGPHENALFLHTDLLGDVGDRAASTAALTQTAYALLSDLARHQPAAVKS